MMHVQSLLAQPVDTERLSQGLLTHLAASGMPLPEDGSVVDHVRAAVRYGPTRAALLVCAGAAYGIAAWHKDDNIGNITMLYVLDEVPIVAVRDLLTWVLDDLATQAETVEAVAELPKVLPQMREALADLGFVGAERILMELALGRIPDTPFNLPADYRLTAWQDDSLALAADVVYWANVGTVDALLIPELQSRQATRRIVELTRQGRYGAFDRAASGLVYLGDAVVGVTLVTRRHSGQGFTAEICVLPAHQRLGLARALMLHTQTAQQDEGLPCNTLGVTVGNPAYRLYHSLGYRPIGSVWTYIYPRPEKWPVEQGADNAPKNL